MSIFKFISRFFLLKLMYMFIPGLIINNMYLLFCPNSFLNNGQLSLIRRTEVSQPFIDWKKTTLCNILSLVYYSWLINSLTEVIWVGDLKDE